MARAIDADRLADGLKLHRQPTDQKHKADRQWAVGYNAGLDRALYSIAYAPTLTQPNELLTLEELREMDEPTPVWWKRAGCWCLCERGFIIAPNGNIYEFEETDRTFYRRPPEGKTDA